MAESKAETGRIGPLTRLRVLDLGTMVAGPVAATLMADFGAEVIKVEQPGTGDTIRELGPFYKDEGLWWQVEGRNKQSITLDLRQAEGQALLKKLVAQADVVIENFRPGTLDKWGLGYADLAAANPGIVMLSVSGFGQTGPNAGRAGYDRIGLAFSGLMAITGYPDRPPVRIGTSMADYTTAILGAFAVMMALYHRDVNGGKGQQIDLALYESVFRCTDSMALAYDRLGKMRERTGNVHQAAAPGNNYETKDGRFLTMTISGDTLFRRLSLAMDRADMADDPRYASHTLRWEHIAQLNDIVGTWIRMNEVEHVTGALTRNGIPFSLAMTVKDIFEDPHYAARGNLATVDHPVLGKMKMQGVVPRLSGTPGGPIRPAPDLGQHTDVVLGNVLGLDAQALEQLRARSVI
jgi:crotonobetainyl-CoA:carnitine CoA-transferase CaiB-like acyl-CoA transferase